MTGPPVEVGLLKLFTNATEYRCLLGDIPTQVFPQLRMLLAIVYLAADGPSTVHEWSQFWSNGSLPLEQIDSYLRDPDVRARFDLLHPVTPFYQVADLRTANNEIFGLERLIADVPTGERFFTTRDGPGLERLTFAEAARWLVHCHAYDVSGIKSGAVGDQRVKGGKGYPIGTGQCGTLGGLYVEGHNLAETLLLNLIPFRCFDDHADDELDVPVWQREAHTAAEEEPADNAMRPYGPIDLYTWQSRRIRLVADAEGVTGVLVCNGDKYTPQNRHEIEPMTAWRRSKAQEKALKQALVFMPRAHMPSRSLWRGLEALLPSALPADHAPDSRPPKVLTWLTTAEAEGGLAPGYRMRLHATGIQYGTQNSVVEEVIDDTVSMPVQLVVDSDGRLRTLVRDALAAAEKATAALASLAGNLDRAGGGDPDAVTAARDRAYVAAYSALDTSFRRWLADLEPDTDLVGARRTWELAIRTVVDGLGDRFVAEAGQKAWAGREVDGRVLDGSLTEMWFRSALRKAVPLAYKSTPAEAPA